MTRVPTAHLARHICMSVLAFTLCGIAPTASAAIISGPLVQDITSNTDTALVQNTGTYVSGKNIGNAGTSVTLNSVLFKNTASGFTFEGASNTPGTIRYLGGSAAASGLYNATNTGLPYASDFNGLLNSTTFNSTREAIVGLDPLKTYRVQLLVGDNRAGSNVTHSYAIRAGSFNGGSPGIYTEVPTDLATFSVANVGGTGASQRSAFIATFTFDGYSAIDIRSTGVQGFMSGISVFDVTAVPEPGTYALLFCCGVAGWIFKRKLSGRTISLVG
jgi:hypothetical protein